MTGLPEFKNSKEEAPVMRSVVEELTYYRNFPVLSVIVSLGLVAHENEIKLRSVLGQAFDLTPKRLLRVDRDIFFARLELMLMELSLAGHPKSVAIFVGKDFIRLVPLNYVAVDRIVVDKACAISEVLYSSTKFPCFNVIVLGSKQARVYEAFADRLVETKSCRHVELLSHLLKIGVDAIKATPGENGKNGINGGSYTHKLHHAFLAVLKDLDHPAIVIGSDRIGDLCPEMTKYISGVAEGDFEFVSNAEIGRLAAEMADAWVQSKMEHAVAAIEKFRQDKKFSSGVDEVNALVEEGCVDKLYLEELPASGVEAGDAHKLTMLDKVLSSALKSNAEIFFLPAGSLAEYGGIVAGRR